MSKRADKTKNNKKPTKASLRDPDYELNKIRIKELLRPTVVKDFKLKYIENAPIVLDEKGFPTTIPNTNLKIVRKEDDCQRYYLFYCPDLDCDVRIAYYTPENERYFRKESYMMVKAYRLGIVPKLHFAIFNKDFLYIICESKKVTTIYDLYGTCVPAHIFKSIRKMLWVLFIEGYEYPEIVPQNFLVTDNNYLMLRNFDHAYIIHNFRQHTINPFLARFMFAEMEAWNPDFTDINNNREITNDFELQYNYLPLYMKNFTKPMFDKDEEMRKKLLEEKKINIWDYYLPSFIAGSDISYKLHGVFENVVIPKPPFKNGRFQTEILFGGEPIDENNPQQNPITEFIKLIEQINSNSENTDLSVEIKKLQDMMDDIQSGNFKVKNKEDNLQEDNLQEFDFDEDSEDSKEIEERKKKEELRKLDHEKHIKSQLEIKQQVDELLKKRDKILEEQDNNKTTTKRTYTKKTKDNLENKEEKKKAVRITKKNTKNDT